MLMKRILFKKFSTSTNRINFKSIPKVYNILKKDLIPFLNLENVTI